jgi:hypothetical protein
VTAFDVTDSLRDVGRSVAIDGVSNRRTYSLTGGTVNVGAVADGRGRGPIRRVGGIPDVRVAGSVGAVSCISNRAIARAIGAVGRITNLHVCGRLSVRGGGARHTP